MGDGISGLRLGEVDDPSAGAGQVVIRLKLAGLNPADRYVAENLYPARPSFPHILGRDGLGDVIEVGRDVNQFKIGDRVIVLAGEAGINRPGTFAEKLAADVDTLAVVPNGWTDEQAAGAPLVYNTAYQALTQWGALPAGAVVLISGASGGVGVASLQLAVAGGLLAIGLSRHAEKAWTLRALGAQAVFDPSDANWKNDAKAFLDSLPLKPQLQSSARAGKRRVDLAIDSVGGEGLTDMIELLGEHGRVSCVGRLAGPIPDFNTATLFFRRIRIGGVAVHSYTLNESHAAWTAVVQTLEAHHARPLIDSIFAFGKLKEAFATLHRGPMGKVLIQT